MFITRGGGGGWVKGHLNNVNVNALLEREGFPNLVLPNLWIKGAWEVSWEASWFGGFSLDPLEKRGEKLSACRSVVA